MALQTAASVSSQLKAARWRLRLGSSLVALVRAVWGVTAGLLFILAFPLAILLAPVLWAIGKALGEPGDA